MILIGVPFALRQAGQGESLEHRNQHDDWICLWDHLLSLPLLRKIRNLVSLLSSWIPTVLFGLAASSP